MAYRVGVDVGGTFTDLLVTDEFGKTEIIKTSTTPNDPSVGFFRGLEKAGNGVRQQHVSPRSHGIRRVFLYRTSSS